MRPLVPTATFAGLRAAELDLDMEPTPAPQIDFDILKRFNGDPAICGWVEGQAMPAKHPIAIHTGIRKGLEDMDVHPPQGAIAGAVAGSVLALAAIVGVVVFFVKRRRTKRDQERQAANVMSERARQSMMYAEYAKPAAPSTLSPPMSPPMHSRHPSDQTYGFASSPPLSDQDRPWSPGSMHSRNGPAELAGENEGHPFQKR
ncbi:MAG: hypothetical protein Q9222_005867 [Ikaeria aurantiellina]